MEALDDQDWRRLVRSIQRGNCILLLGPDAATDPADPAGLPLGQRLAQTLTERLAAGAVPDPTDLPAVAQAFVDTEGQGRIALELEVEDFCRAYTGRTTPLHDHLAALPFPIYINTAPDTALANALRAGGRAPQVEFYDFRRARPFALSDPTPDQPWVYDLYGSLDQPESLVLTERDLLDYLVNVIKETPRLPPPLITRLRDPDTSLLFVCFGFRRWYLRILLHVLRAYAPPRNPPLALEDSAFYAHPEGPQAMVFFHRAHHIRFHHVSSLDFAAKLCHRYQALAARPAVHEPPADAPMLFLSYVTEDFPVAEGLAERLRAAGLRTWLDRQRLRGGDRWGLLIPEVIAHQVDYVLVLQTPRLLARDESYVYLEIAQAQERQAKGAPGRRFLIPVQLEPGERLPTLAPLHFADLTVPDGFASLVAGIREDWQQRRARATGGETP